MKKYLLIALISALTACSPAPRSESATTLTTGVVQKEIRIGMPGSDVAQVLGSPNIVSLDENKDEIWVYDKVSTEVVYSSGAGGVWLLLFGVDKESGYSEKSQRTLTVIIKLNEDKKVTDFTYRASSF